MGEKEKTVNRASLQSRSPAGALPASDWIPGSTPNWESRAPLSAKGTNFYGSPLLSQCAGRWKFLWGPLYTWLSHFLPEHKPTTPHKEDLRPARSSGSRGPPGQTRSSGEDMVSKSQVASLCTTWSCVSG